MEEVIKVKTLKHLKHITSETLYDKPEEHILNIIDYSWDMHHLSKNKSKSVR